MAPRGAGGLRSCARRPPTCSPSCACTPRLRTRPWPRPPPRRRAHEPPGGRWRSDSAGRSSRPGGGRLGGARVQVGVPRGRHRWTPQLCRSHSGELDVGRSCLPTRPARSACSACGCSTRSLLMRVHIEQAVGAHFGRPTEAPPGRTRCIRCIGTTSARASSRSQGARAPPALASPPRGGNQRGPHGLVPGSSIGAPPGPRGFPSVLRSRVRYARVRAQSTSTSGAASFRTARTVPAPAARCVERLVPEAEDAMRL